MIVFAIPFSGNLQVVSLFEFVLFVFFCFFFFFFFFCQLRWPTGAEGHHVQVEGLEFSCCGMQAAEGHPVRAAFEGGLCDFFFFYFFFFFLC
jgi:hypothetical protein